MPQYEVIDKGFYDGKVYDPEGKRRTLHADKPLKPVPSWVKAIKPETAAEKKKRLTAEKKQAEEDAKKAEEDAKEINDASFLGDGESGSNVETL